jgi:hypothetical protein
LTEPSTRDLVQFLEKFPLSTVQAAACWRSARAGAQKISRLTLVGLAVSTVVSTILNQLKLTIGKDEVIVWDLIRHWLSSGDGLIGP